MSDTQAITPLGKIEINGLLDTYRERHGITSDEKLADRLGVSSQAIYRWRRLEIADSTLILLSVDRELSACPTST